MPLNPFIPNSIVCTANIRQMTDYDVYKHF